MKIMEDIHIAWRNYVLPFPHPGGWALHPDTCKYLGTFVQYFAFDNILEFGSGYSSLIIANELRNIGHGAFNSIDSSTFWSKKAELLATQYCLSSFVQFHVFALVFKYGRYPNIFFNISKAFYRQHPLLDLVIVDAPPHFIGRDGALHEILNHVRLGGFVFADDAASDHMRATLKKWELHYPRSIRIERLNVGNGIAIIQKVDIISGEPRLSIKSALIESLRAFRNFVRLKQWTRSLP